MLQKDLEMNQTIKKIFAQINNPINLKHIRKLKQFYKTLSSLFKLINNNQAQSDQNSSYIISPKNSLLTKSTFSILKNQMRPTKRQSQQLPMLLFLLEHKKHHELIKSIFNENMSKKFLEEYGYQKTQLSKKDEFKLSQDALHFTIEDLIQIKGSSQSKVKRFQNDLLAQTIVKKLKDNYVVENAQRKLFWVQFTQIYAESSLYEGLEDLELPPDTECILDKDIKRTYYNLPTKNPEQKDKQTQILRQSLKQSLSRFALYNPFLLYCQGMNEVFGFLHEEKFSPKQSFFIFKRITQVLLPSDYYSSLEGIVAYLKVLWDMISVCYPKIHLKLNFLIKEMDFSGSYLCVFSHVLQWFVCLFTNSMLNREIRKVIMDYFLLQGINVFFKVSLAIFEYLEDTILKANTFQSYVMKVEETVRNYTNVEHLRNFLNNKFISKEILWLMKEYVTSPQQLHQKKITPFTKKCYKKWNFCLQQLQNNFHSQHKCDFFVFKTKPSVNLIPDYLKKLNTYYFEKKKNYKAIDLLRIGRIPHVCKSQSEEGTEDSLSQNNNRKKELGLSNRLSPSPNNCYSISINEVSTTSVKNQNNPKSLNPSQHPPLQQFTIDQIHLPQPTSILQPPQSTISSSCIAVDDQDSIYHRKQTLEYREMIKQKFLKQTSRRSLQRSESMMFMKMMVDNESYSNLFSLLENDQMDKMFDLNSDSEDQQKAK